MRMHPSGGRRAEAECDEGDLPNNKKRKKEKKQYVHTKGHDDACGRRMTNMQIQFLLQSRCVSICKLQQIVRRAPRTIHTQSCVHARFPEQHRGLE